MSDQQPTAEQAEATPAPDGEQQQATEQQPQFDPGQFTDRLDQLGSSVNELLNLAQQPAYEDPYAGQPQYDPYTGQPVQEQQFDPNDPASVQQLVQQGIQQAVGPIQQELYQRDMNDLFQRYPDIQGDQAVRTGVLENVQRLGFNPQNDMVPAKAVEVAYKAFKADQIAGQQQPVESTSSAPNEQGGAAPATPESDPVDEWLGPRSERPAGSVFGWTQR